MTDPAPLLLPKRPGLLDQGMCLEARKAISTFLDGSEIGERGLLFLSPFIRPYTQSFERMAKELYDRAHSLVYQKKLAQNDPIFNDIESLLERAKFYNEVVEEVANDSAEAQRLELWDFVVAPMFFGQGFKTYFDSDTDWITKPSDYCSPMRIANQLGVSVNLYDELWGRYDKFSVIAWWIPLSPAAEGVSDMIENNVGSAEEVTRFYRKAIKPALDSAKEGRDASLALLETAGHLAQKGAETGLFIAGLAGIAGWLVWRAFKKGKR